MLKDKKKILTMISPLLFTLFSMVQGTKLMLLERGEIAYYKNNGSKVYNPLNNMIELVLHAGYDIEHHTVTTDDGYLLSLFHIPAKENSSKQTPHIIQTGLFSDTDVLCLVAYENSLPFRLHDTGYDVWLISARGKGYSVGHVSLDTCDMCEEYWNFTIDDRAKYDTPNLIDYVLNYTKRDQLYYHAPSMASAELLAALAEKPEYNQKIKLAILEAPAVFFEHSSSFLKSFAQNLEEITEKLKKKKKRLYGTANDLSPKMKWFNYCHIDSALMTHLCAKFLKRELGMADQVSIPIIPLFASYFPAQEGLYSVVQMGQNLRKAERKFYKYDYGLEMNMKQYGQAEPPAYNFTKVSAPVLLIVGDGDKEASLKDSQTLDSILPNSYLHQVSKEGWSHMDRQLGKHYGKFVVAQIFEFMKKIEN